MRSILEELWYEYVGQTMAYRESSDEIKQLMTFIADHHNNLYKTLTDEQKEILDKFDDCCTELTDINEREIFVYAFRLGAKTAVEVLCHDGE